MPGWDRFCSRLTSAMRRSSSTKPPTARPSSTPSTRSSSTARRPIKPSKAPRTKFKRCSTSTGHPSNLEPDRAPPKRRRHTCFGSGALRPPPPVVAPLVPRCALLPAATPRLMRHLSRANTTLSSFRHSTRSERSDAVGAGLARAEERVEMSLSQRRALTAYLLLLASLAFFVFIRIAPTLSALQVAFYQWDMLSDERPFVGLDNFQRLTNDAMFRAALGNTLKYVGLGVPTGLVMALAIALALARIRRLAGFFRTVYFIPFITSLVAAGWVWRWLYQPQRGSINELLGLVGIPSQPFLQSTSQALPSIVAVNVWHDLGFQIVIFLAGLHAIPDVYYEAATLDGAGRWALFRHITLPLLNPTIVFLAVTSAISSLQVF